MSSDAVVASGLVVQRPSERPETPIGSTAFVLDVAERAVYEFDFGRGRMLGPAPRIIDPLGNPRVLPGYPFVYGSGPAISQGECAGRSGVAVAEGVAGTIAILPLLPDGTLGAPRHLNVPTVKVRVDAKHGGGEAMNHSPMGPQPDADHIVCFPDGRIVVITQDENFGTSVAYVTDKAETQFVTAKQLPGTVTVTTTLVGQDRFATATNDGVLAEMTVGLQPVAVSTFSGSIDNLAWTDGRVVLHTTAPDQFVQVSDTTLSPLQTTSLGTNAGPLLARTDGSNGFIVGNFDQGEVDLVDAHFMAARKLPTCKEVFALAVANQHLLAVCRGVPSHIAYLDLASGQLQISFGGGDPIAIVQPMASS